MSADLPGIIIIPPGTGGGGGTPDAHAASHENGGSDEISVAGLSGLLADPQTPLAYPGQRAGRLSLTPNHAVYAPQIFTPTSTDTGTDVLTFDSDPGWDTGTLMTPDVTAGGVTIGTTYYARRLTATTYALYTTLADCLADTSRVNLTASITAEFRPAGVAQTTLWLLPWHGKDISLYTGSAWVTYTLPDAGINQALAGLLTAGSVYDVFLDYNDGTPQLVFGEPWVDPTGTAEQPRDTLSLLGVQDTIAVLASDHQQRHIATVYASATDTLEIIPGRPQYADGTTLAAVNSPARIGVWNSDDWVCVDVDLIRQEEAASWTYSSATPRQARASAINQIEVVSGAPVPISVEIHARMSHSAGGAVDALNAIGIDGAAVAAGTPPGTRSQARMTVAAAAYRNHAILMTTLMGYHTYTWNEWATATITTTWIGAYGSGIYARWRY
jgi:hypothetical protein